MTMASIEGGRRRSDQQGDEEPDIVYDNDDDDDEDERQPITAPYGFAHDITTQQQQQPPPHLQNSTSCLPSLNTTTKLLLVVICTLLGADVSLRVANKKSSYCSLDDDWTSGRRRFVPHRDILNQTSDENDLKYTDDVGNYPLQGLAIGSNDDGNHQKKLLYEVHTLAIRVLQLDGDNDVGNVRARRVWDGATDFPPLRNGAVVAHIGGVDLARSAAHGTELWLATHSDGTDGVGGLFAVDPTTLDVVRDRSVLTDYNLDWVAFSNGVLYYGEFFNVRVVHRVAIDTLQVLDDLTLQLPDRLRGGGINYVQSAAFDFRGRLVLLGDDYQCTIYVLNVDTGELVHSQGLLLGSETDGITFVHSRGRENTMLVGFNRQHSHEQVMKQEPMVSVIQLVLQ